MPPSPEGAGESVRPPCPDDVLHLRKLLGGRFVKQESSWRDRKRAPEVNHDTGERSVVFRWENRVESGDHPCPRSGHTVSVHEDLGLALLFGGLGDGVNVETDTLFNDTWYYNRHDGAWHQIAVRGDTPAPVFGHTAEIVNFDPENLCLLIFGGQGEAGVLYHDTFVLVNVLNDPVWYRVPDFHHCCQSTLYRWGHTMTAIFEAPGSVSAITKERVPDSGNLQLLVFGGMTCAQESLSDLIAFDVRQLTWRDVSVLQDNVRRASPMGRRRHVSVVDPTTHKMWVFGGRSEWNHFLCDLWYFDYQSRIWTELLRPGHPKPRTGHCGSLHGMHFYIFGGFELVPVGQKWEYTLHNDLHRFNTATSEWEVVTPTQAAMPATSPGSSSSSSSSSSSALSPVSAGTTSIGGGHHACGEAGTAVACRVPRKRSMAASYLLHNRLFIHGGRDKDCAFHCTFSVPLPAVQQMSLAEHVAHFIVTHRIRYVNERLPTTVVSLLDSIFCPAHNDTSSTSSVTSFKDRLKPFGTSEDFGGVSDEGLGEGEGDGEDADEDGTVHGVSDGSLSVTSETPLLGGSSGAQGTELGEEELV